MIKLKLSYLKWVFLFVFFNINKGVDYTMKHNLVYCLTVSISVGKFNLHCAIVFHFENNQMASTGMRMAYRKTTTEKQEKNPQSELSHMCQNRWENNFLFQTSSGKIGNRVKTGNSHPCSIFSDKIKPQ